MKIKSINKQNCLRNCKFAFFFPFFLFVFVLGATSVMAQDSPKTAAGDVPPYIGKKMGGGIVFYIDKKGKHGLIASPFDQGRGNWFQAVQLCKVYRGGGYSDWFMPSKKQSFALYQVRGAVGGFEQALYWTSSEGRRGAARNGVWIEGWDDGKLYSNKDPNYIYNYVRAIRAF